MGDSIHWGGSHSRGAKTSPLPRICQTWGRQVSIGRIPWCGVWGRTVCAWARGRGQRRSHCWEGTWGPLLKGIVLHLVKFGGGWDMLGLEWGREGGQAAEEELEGQRLDAGGQSWSCLVWRGWNIGGGRTYGRVKKLNNRHEMILIKKRKVFYLDIISKSGKNS